MLYRLSYAHHSRCDFSLAQLSRCAFARRRAHIYVDRLACVTRRGVRPRTLRGRAAHAGIVRIYYDFFSGVVFFSTGFSSVAVRWWFSYS